MKESIHKNFENFFKNPTHDTLYELLSENYGETKLYDFKVEWPEYSKIAKHILGFSNSGGGAIIIGVRQEDDNTFDTKGLKNLIDKSEINKGIRKYIPEKLYEVLDFSYDNKPKHKELNGKKFQVIIIKDNSTQIPFVSNQDGNGIIKGVVYARKEESTEPVNNDELQEVINRRTKECDEVKNLERYTPKSNRIYSSQIIIIGKDEYTNLGIYKAKLYKYNQGRGATLKISVNENDIQCIAFDQGLYKFERYGIYVQTLCPDFISLRIEEIPY